MGGVSANVAPGHFPRAVEVRAKAATVSSGKMAVENHMKILERSFLLVQTAFKSARAANAGTKPRLER